MKQAHLLLLIASVTATWWIGAAKHSSGATPPELEAMTEKVYHDLRPSVFIVKAYSHMKSGGGTSSDTSSPVKWERHVGTAVPIDSLGHLITTFSVVKNAESIRIITDDGAKIPAEMIGNDVTGRIAVLKIDRRYITNVPPIGSLESVKSGDNVFFLGVGPGMAIEASLGTVNRIRNTDGTFEVVMDGTHITSGTPVFDSDKNVIGLLAFQVGPPTRRDGTRLTYLNISLEQAAMLAKLVIRDLDPPKKPCGWLGVCIDITSTKKDGIPVVSVIPDSPADHAGIAGGDIIIECDGKPQTTPPGFVSAISDRSAGDTTNVTVLRNNRRMTFSITLTRPPTAFPQTAPLR